MVFLTKVSQREVYFAKAGHTIMLFVKAIYIDSYHPKIAFYKNILYLSLKTQCFCMGNMYMQNNQLLMKPTDRSGETN
jgi:hypothetical protein